MMLKYEMKKILNKRINKILLVAVLLLSVLFSILAIGSFEFTDTDGNNHTGVSAPRSLIADKNRWKGELTPEKIADFVNTYNDAVRLYQNNIPNDVYGRDIQSGYDIIAPASRMLTGEYGDSDDPEAILKADPDQIASIYEIYNNNLAAMSEFNGDTPDKAAFLLKHYKKIKTPFYYEAADSWDSMYLYVSTFSIVLLVVIGFLTAGIFTEEFQNRSASVFFSTRFGRSKAVRNKVLSGIIITILVYGCGMGLMSAIFFAVAGTSGADVAYQCLYPYAIYSVTCSQMYWIMVLSGFVASLLSAAVAMFVASKTKAISPSVAAPFVLFCVSPLLGRALPFKTFFLLSPGELTNLLNDARDVYIFQIGTVVFRQIPFLIIFYSMIALALIPLVYRNYHKLLLK